MKTKIIYTGILLLSVLSLFTNAQPYTEKLRADFLTNYYSNYQNELRHDSSQINVSDSLATKNLLNRTDEINDNKPSSNQSVNLDNLRANFLSSLKSENTGVVESAIYVSIQFKNKFPYENVTNYIKVLDEIAKNGVNSRISYKAQLAKIYLINSDWFENIKINSIDKEKEVYAAIAETITEKLFSE